MQLTLRSQTDKQSAGGVKKTASKLTIDNVHSKSAMFTGIVEIIGGLLPHFLTIISSDSA